MSEPVPQEEVVPQNPIDAQPDLQTLVQEAVATAMAVQMDQFTRLLNDAQVTQGQLTQPTPLLANVILSSLYSWLIARPCSHILSCP